MKKIKKQEGKLTSLSDSLNEVRELQKKLRKIRIDRYTKEMKNTREAKTIRKRIAVLLTHMKEGELIGK